MDIAGLLQTAIRLKHSGTSGNMAYLPQNSRIFTIDSFPDGSRIVEDMLAAAYWATTKSNTLIAELNSLHGPAKGLIEARFPSNMMTEYHKHNYTELAYVVKGRLHQRISGKDEIFNQGELCLLDKDSFHSEYLFPEETVVFFLLIGNSFFSKTVNFEIQKKEHKNFLQNALITRRKKYRFIRFTAKIKKPSICELLGNIFEELKYPNGGSRYLVLGYTERLLNRLLDEYDYHIVKNDGDDTGKQLFNEVQDCMRIHYQNISTNKLSEIFGYNIDYFNRLIKSHAGMTYSQLLHNIRLEIAAHLLQSTKLPVEEIAKEIGYHNITYFYTIFFKKHGMTPHAFRINH
jgi:AraC-like DNA-binding protein